MSESDNPSLPAGSEAEDKAKASNESNSKESKSSGSSSKSSKKEEEEAAAAIPSHDAPASSNESGPKITAGSDGQKGTRPTMEDAHTVIDKIKLDNIPPEKAFAFFGVYDGHGGRRCADLTKVHFFLSLTLA